MLGNYIDYNNNTLIYNNKQLSKVLKLVKF